MPLTLTRTTDAAADPVLYSEMGPHLRVDSDVDQDYITGLITAARMHVEEQLERQLITATWCLRLDRFPSFREDTIALPRPPLLAVSSITYYDSDSVLQTWDPTQYQVDIYSELARVRLASGVFWPSTSYQKLNAVAITYTAGYGAAGTAVPAPIKHAIKMLVSHWYESREPIVVGQIIAKVPMAVDALLGPYRVWTER